MTRLSLLLLVLALFTTGCHRRYQKAAPDLGSVKLDVVLDVAPSIDGVAIPDAEAPASASDAVALGTDIATAALALKVGQILNKAVDPAAVEAGLTKAVVDKTERRSPPYAVSENKGKGDLEITITGYGLSVDGGKPAVWLSTKTAIYERGGDKVYRATERCETELPSILPIALPGRAGELQAMASLAELKPKELETLLGALAVSCGKKVASELVEHAKS